MSTQITVRLPDDVVGFLDDAVSAGEESSRAALVTKALQREMRRWAALRDAEVLREKGTADDLDDLVAWTARNPVFAD